MHHALHVSEILAHVMSYVGDSNSRQSLVACAGVCKSFQEHAYDLLYETICRRSLFHLIGILSPLELPGDTSQRPDYSVYILVYTSPLFSLIYVQDVG